MKVCLTLLATCLLVGLSSGTSVLHHNNKFCGDNVPTSQTYGCRYFTKDYNDKYVCDRNQKPESTCPPLRPTCTRNFSGGPPVECVTDNDCAYSDKCCCDACLDHPVCKPPYN
ncbi:uncharacterized protein LOC126999487 [Eriocheir sinensis]|uniref:Crustin III n=1 Tax=Eriocheir sinensis TaxID=95602 RepID=C5MTC8_ERISI|nr:uncharacterized protein LOC126999487 [Eriocheir sinensis]ACF25908.1 crustin-2 [Eriocheir sinensis]ACS32493.1 crustin III [Eriocheir sinensis]